ncbi:MAG: thioredoxin family protein [Planctomycetota bacterium]|jgi:thioredoxin-related protein
MNTPTATNETSTRRGTQLRWALLLVVAAVVAYGIGLPRASSGSDWPEDYAQAQRNATAAGRPLLIQFASAACPYCVRMQREVLSKSDVTDQLASFELVRVDAWEEEELSVRFAVEAVPSFVALDPDGRFLGKAEGYRSAAEFLEFLRRSAGAAGMTPTR